MPVYVDDYGAPFRNMVMCHMIADTREELLEMADKIGVQSVERPEDSREIRVWRADRGGKPCLR